jgi:hypothetical protein
VLTGLGPPDSGVIADVEFVDPSANDGEYGIVAVHLTIPTGSVVLD